MATILGISGIEKVAEHFEEVARGVKSESIGLIGDSNMTQNGGGFSRGISAAMRKVMFRPIIASAPTIGLFINDGSGRTSFLDEQHLSVQAAAQGAYASAPAGLRGFFPYNSSGALDTIIQAVCDNEPARFHTGVAGMGTPYIEILQSSDPLGHDIFEKFDVWEPHVKGPGLGSLNMWTRSRDALFGLFNVGYVDEFVNESAGSFAYNDGYCGQMAAGQVRAGDVAFQILPFGTSWPHTGEGLVYSALITYPDRPHGYCIGPMLMRGGTSMDQHGTAFGALSSDWIDSQIRMLALGLGGRDGRIRFEIHLGLNDRASGDTTQSQYKADLDVIVNAVEARYAALKALGLLANVKGLVWVFVVCGFRLPASPESLDHCYAACLEKEATMNNACVMDARAFLTAGEATRICTDGAHLNGVTDYDRIAYENTARLFTAARLARRAAKLP